MKLIVEKYYQASDGTKFYYVGQNPEETKSNITVFTDADAMNECAKYEHQLLKAILMALEEDNHIKLLTRINSDTKRAFVYEPPFNENIYHMYGLPSGIIFQIKDMEAIEALNKALLPFTDLRRTIECPNNEDYQYTSNPIFDKKDIDAIFDTIYVANKGKMFINQSLYYQEMQYRKKADQLCDMRYDLLGIPRSYE